MDECPLPKAPRMHVKYTLGCMEAPVACVCNTDPCDGEKLDQGDHLYKWDVDQAQTVHSLPVSSMHKFSIYLSDPHFHWRDVWIECDPSTFDFGQTMYAQNIGGLEGWIHLTYSASKKFCPEYGGLMVSFKLFKIVLFVRQVLVVQKTILEEYENHKMVAFVSLKQQNGRKELGIPLGRAQRIHTTSHNGLRTYQWETNGKMTHTEEEEGFPGVPRRTSLNSHMDDLLDWENMKQGPLLSARRMRNIAYEPDNDNFSNKNSVLPVIVGQNFNVSIQFSNAKMKPAPTTAMTITWQEIENALNLQRTPQRRWSVASSRRKSWAAQNTMVLTFVEFQLSPNISGKVGFETMPAKKTRLPQCSVYLAWIELSIDNYVMTLPTMDVNSGPMTARK